MTPSSSQTASPNTQRAFFVALALGAAAVVAYMFCVQPTQTSLARAKGELENLQQAQGIASRDIRGAQQLKERVAELEKTRQPYLDGLLSPLLGSYAMRAKSIVDPVAAESGVSVVDYAELPKRLLPLVKPQAPQLYARQPVRLTCRGSYAALVSFLLRLEKLAAERPLLKFVSTQALSFKSQQNNDQQTATLVLEWPVLGVNTVQQAQAAAAKGGVKK